MGVVFAFASLALIVAILVDAFETTVLPRRVTHRFRFVRLYYRGTWALWRQLALRLRAGKWREAFLGLFGPASLLGLLIIWVLGLILGFALLHWSLGTELDVKGIALDFSTYLYWSGDTFFTLGYGDVIPASPFGRALAVAEAGMGFGFLAIIIGYLPVIHQNYSHREILIAVLDARAGSPPSAGQLLLRQARSGDLAAIDSFLAEWERWSAELLESHLSFPFLSFYRSQHDNQSWLAALTTVLDACAFLMGGVKGHNPYQAQVTFAMARHAAVDLALVFRVPPVAPEPDRLPDSRLRQIRDELREAGLSLHEGPAVDAKLAELRAMYEPFVNALSRRFHFPLPPFVPDQPSADNWQRSAWLKRAPEIGSLPIAATGDEHFD
jgi:voltage-gated potassium channel Kch